MKKVLFVATVVKTHIMEFHIPYLKMFKEMGWETAVAARNDYENPADCVIPYCDIYYNIPFERNPLKPGNLKAYKELKHIIDEGEYDIVHCHTPVGAMLTRLAAKQARRKGTKVFYTAHGFHFYKGAPAINWILYYPVEKWLSRYTDVLITINKEDYERAKTFKASKVCYVPGVGIDLKKFNEGYVNKEQKRREIGVSANDFVLLSVGELIPRKKEYICCHELEDIIELVGFQSNPYPYLNAGKVMVMPSIWEGFGLAAVEGMCLGKPVVCSGVGGMDKIIDASCGAKCRTTDEYSRILVELLNDNTVYEVKSKNAMRKSGRYTDMKKYADDICRIYKATIER